MNEIRPGNLVLNTLSEEYDTECSKEEMGTGRVSVEINGNEVMVWNLSRLKIYLFIIEEEKEKKKIFFS